MRNLRESETAVGEASAQSGFFKAALPIAAAYDELQSFGSLAAPP